MLQCTNRVYIYKLNTRSLSMHIVIISHIQSRTSDLLCTDPSYGVQSGCASPHSRACTRPAAWMQQPSANSSTKNLRIGAQRASRVMPFWRTIPPHNKELQRHLSRWNDLTVLEDSYCRSRSVNVLQWLHRPTQTMEKNSFFECFDRLPYHQP